MSCFLKGIPTVTTGNHHGDIWYFYFTLYNWNFLSSFAGTEEDHSGVWECPDLFPLIVSGTQEEKWILTVSINDGSPAGGTGMKYFVGTYDGFRFMVDVQIPFGRWMDYGKDYYAGVTWNHAPNGRRLMIAWADNWQYRDYLPTEPFLGQLSCVRELQLYQEGTSYALRQMPAREWESLRKDKKELKSIEIACGEEWVISSDTDCLELDLRYDLQEMNADRFGIRIGTGNDQEFSIMFVRHENCCIVDRQNAGLNPHVLFGGEYSAPLDLSGRFLHVRLLLDASQSELFLNDGEVVMTNLLFPTELYLVRMVADDGTAMVRQGEIYNLEKDVIS